MGNFILSIMLALNIGAVGDLEQAFKKEDTKYLEKFVSGPIIVHSFGGAMMMDKESVCEYFDLVFRDMNIVDVKIERPYREKKSFYLVTLYTNNNGLFVTNKLIFDIYKKKIVQIHI